MVPSDSLNSLTPAGMHGMNVCNRGNGRYLLCSPPLLLWNSGSALRSPSASSSRLEPAARNGLSLPPNDCPLPDHHSKIKVSGLSLRCPAKLRFELVRSAAPPP